MTKNRSKNGNFHNSGYLVSEMILSIVCIGTYFIDCELNFIALFFMETLNIPHIHLGIYSSKLTCFRSIFIILGCLTEYGIYKICNRFKLGEKHPKYREGLSIFFLFALCVVRIIISFILCFSKQLPLHLYTILNVEAFYFGIFQVSFISLAMDHSGEIKLFNYFLSTIIKIIQFTINRSRTNKPMLFLKVNFFICIAISIISLIMWPVYLFCFHKPLYQYDEYIFSVRTGMNLIISHSEECIEIINDVRKKMEKIDIPESDEKNKIGKEISSTAEDEDSQNDKDSTISDNGESVETDDEDYEYEDERSTSEDEDDIDDVIISTTEKQNSSRVDNANKTKNNEIDENNKLIKELLDQLKQIDDFKLYDAGVNIFNKNHKMTLYSGKHKEFHELLAKETNSLLDSCNKIKIFQSTVNRLRKELPWGRGQIKHKLKYLNGEISKALEKIKILSRNSKNFNEQIKKIAHKNLKWALSTMLMIIPSTIIFHFLFDGIVPHAITIDEDANKIIVLTTVALSLGSMPPVIMTSKKHEYRYWTWQNSCFWLALIPQIAILVSAILAIHSKMYQFKSIIDEPVIVAIMCSILAICHSLMESTSFLSVTNHVYFHSVDPDDFYLVIIQIVLRTYLKFVSLKLSACYNEARISLGFYRPDFYTFLEVEPLEAFMITMKETFRRFFFDLFFDIRVNINQFI